MKLLLEIFFCLMSFSLVAADCDNKVKVVCYWGTWSIYRPEIGQFTSENIDPSLCTNIVYTFVGLGIDSNIQNLDSWADIDLGGFANVTAFKTENECLKTTLAIGGWNEGSIKYSVMASTEDSRQRFANNVLRYLTYYGFDGLDLDWEYPTTRGGIPADGQNYAALLKTIKDTISPWGLILTIAAAVDQSLIGTAYHITAIAEYVDEVHLMAYDYTTSNSKETGLSAPLSGIKKTVTNWLDAGLPSEKLILGIPTYGRNYILDDDDQHDIGAPVYSIGDPGLYTSENGFLAYYEIQDILKTGMEVVEEDDTTYAYGNYEWITFETVDSVRAKTQYALDNNLGGLMVWSLDTDDFRGDYGKKYPLLSTINEVIGENKAAGKR